MRKDLLVACVSGITIAWIGGCGDDGPPGEPGGGGEGDPGPSPMADGGAPDPGSGGGEPPDVPVTISSSCPAFDGCGGDPTGTWHYTDACVEDPFEELYEACPGAMVDDVVGTARGSVALTGSHVIRDVTVHVSATAHLPARCAAVGCDTIESAIATGGGSASCAPAGTGCDCQLEATETDVSDEGYTVDGDVLTTDDGERFEFCVAGSDLTYRPLDVDEEAVYELARR